MHHKDQPKGLTINQDCTLTLIVYITGDFIAKWCTEHGLSEQTASILRRNGFISQDAVNSLRLDIIPRLQLNNIGQECILRRIIAPNAPRVSESSTGKCD